jgi:hypothetical protein
MHIATANKAAKHIQQQLTAGSRGILATECACTSSTLQTLQNIWCAFAVSSTLKMNHKDTAAEQVYYLTAAAKRLPQNQEVLTCRAQRSAASISKSVRIACAGCCKIIGCWPAAKQAMSTPQQWVAYFCPCTYQEYLLHVLASTAAGHS